MTSFATYALPMPGTMLNHYWSRTRTLTVRDEAELDIQELDAIIRSGDYFVTLATSLDALADELRRERHPAHATVNNLIKDLAYAQMHYKIVKKENTTRRSEAQ